jgi:hypothetical protein
MKKSLIIILVLLVLILPMGCAHIGSPIKELTIGEIVGSWENVQFGYIYLLIDESGDGYFIPGFDENDDDIYKIESLSFGAGSVVITFRNINDTDEQVKAECNLFGKDLLVFQPIEENENEDVFIFMRESKVNALRQKAKDYIKSKGLGT